MWQDLIDQKDKWIGGQLIDHGDSMDRSLLKPELLPAITTITGMELTDDSFRILGEEFNCGGSRQYIGLTSEPVENGLAFSGYGGHRWDIVKPA